MDEASGFADSKGISNDSSLGSAISRGETAADHGVHDQSELVIKKGPPTEYTDIPSNPTSTSRPSDQLFPNDAHIGMSNTSSSNKHWQGSPSEEDTTNKSVDNTQPPNQTRFSKSKSRRLNPFNNKPIPSEGSSFSSANSGGDESSSDTASSVKEDVTDNSVPRSTGEILKKPLNEALNDAGQFSYVALCSINLTLLFEDEWNK